MGKEVIGRIDCETCGTMADICEALGKRSGLYTRCTNCGTDQRNGAAVQSRLFYGGIFNEMYRITKPANASEETWRAIQAKANKKQAEAVSEVISDITPEALGESGDAVSEVVSDTVSDTENIPKVSGALWAGLGVLLGVGLLVLGIQGVKK